MLHTVYGFLSFTRKYEKQLLDTGVDALKTASRKVIHNAGEETVEFIGNKIAGKIVKPSRNVKQIAFHQIESNKY